MRMSGVGTNQQVTGILHRRAEDLKPRRVVALSLTKSFGNSSDASAQPYRPSTPSSLPTGAFQQCRVCSSSLAMRERCVGIHPGAPFTISALTGCVVLGGTKISGADIRDQNGAFRLDHGSLHVLTDCLVLATQAIANVVKSSFGPSGLDKMMVDDIGVCV